MGAHYTYLNAITHDTEIQKAITGLIVGSALLVFGVLASTKIRSGASRAAHIVPKKFSLVSFADFLISSFISYHDSIAGKENRKYMSLSATAFFFIFFSNLLGLIPGFPAATSLVWINVGIALVVFISFNLYGIFSQGFIHYMKHFAGPVWWLAWFMFPLEIISTCLRILTLNLRLYWNISADHIVLGVFTDLTKFIVPVVFYGLGTFVCFMQAFVFATLTIVYISLATQHGHGEESHAHH